MTRQTRLFTVAGAAVMILFAARRADAQSAFVTPPINLLYQNFPNPFPLAGLPATCAHDGAGRPDCTPTALFIFAANGGVRFEPVPWLGLSLGLSLGTDTYPNPFGMVEAGLTFAIPVGFD